MPRSADKSIEHITPQSSEEKYIHNLGNLTMLPPGVNSSLKDKPPKEKAAIYKQCGLRGTMAVANSIEVSPWDEKAVLRRTTAYPGTAPRMSRQGRQPRPLRHLPIGRGLGVAADVRRHPVTDRPAAGTARPGMRGSGVMCGKRQRGEACLGAGERACVSVLLPSSGGFNHFWLVAKAICRCPSRARARSYPANVG
jgi:hypothetical protein